MVPSNAKKPSGAKLGPAILSQLSRSPAPYNVTNRGLFSPSGIRPGRKLRSLRSHPRRSYRALHLFSRGVGHPPGHPAMNGSGNPRLHLSRSRRKLSAMTVRASEEQGMCMLSMPIEHNVNSDRVCQTGMSASSTLSRRNIASIYKTLKLQITACLLCLLIVGGSLDGLPDPPVVKPQGIRSKLVSQADHHAPVAANHHGLDCVACAPHVRARLLLSGQFLETRLPSFSLTLVRRAADNSPPCYS